MRRLHPTLNHKMVGLKRAEPRNPSPRIPIRARGNVEINGIKYVMPDLFQHVKSLYKQSIQFSATVSVLITLPGNLIF